MDTPSQGQTGANACPGSAAEQGGCYVYCVAWAAAEARLGPIGIEGRDVYTISREGLCALVHHGAARPYSSADADVAAGWVMAHHRVVDAAWKRWGTVLPMTFNTIVRATDASGAASTVAAWLASESPLLLGKLEDLAGKAEYGVHVLGGTAEPGPEVQRLEAQIPSLPRGLAYMYRQKLERLRAREREDSAAEKLQALVARLSQHVDAIRVETARRGEGAMRTLAHLSCLVSDDRFAGLAAELERIRDTEGYTVRLVGPLPPYSFC